MSSQSLPCADAEAAVDQSLSINSVENEALPEKDSVEVAAIPEPSVAGKAESNQEVPEQDDRASVSATVKKRIIFSDFALSQPVQLAVQQAGYLHPTEVQEQIIPRILDGRDVLAQSQTGTGKTAAFALPLLSQLDGKAGLPKVLVLAPTRELATQVARSFTQYGANVAKLKTVAIFGGADYESQFRALKRGVHVVVGTPGRVMDHLKRGTLKLDEVTSVVLDEADEMLNLGFIEDVEWILQQTPSRKQTALFSATMPAPIRRVADQYLDNPEVVTVRSKTLTAETIEQRCMFVDERHKRELLARLLEIEETDGVIVFTKTKDSTVAVADHLLTLGLKAAALNGDLPQARRQKTVDQLKSGRLNILVATDVAARGLDVQRISHVFNFDLPHDSESYVHRIGRTGRAGRAGVAYIFLTPRQRGKLRLIEKVTKQPIQILDVPSKEELNAARIERFKEQIAKVAKHPEIALYRKVIADLVNNGEQSIEEVAAALAHMSRGGRPLLVDDLPAIQDTRSARPQKERGQRRQQPGRAMKRPGRGMDRYWVGVGHADGMRPGNLVGAIANEVGIPGSEIGPIGIQENYSTVDLPKGLPSDVINVLQRTWVSGKQLRLRPFQEMGSGDGYDAAKSRGGKHAKRGKFSKGKPFNGKSSDGRTASASGLSRSKSKPVGGKPKSKKRFAR